MGRVFIINEPDEEGNAYPELLEKRGYKVFSTANAYKLVRYAKELNHDLYIIDSSLKDTDYRGLVQHLVDNRYSEKAPLVVLKKRLSKTLPQGVSCYLNKKEALNLLPELASAYCRGGKKYDVLLLIHDNKLKINAQSLSRKLKISLFCVFDVKAARIFLQKNDVRAVGVHSLPEKYDDIKKNLPADKIFYVENLANIKDLVSFVS